MKISVNVVAIAFAVAAMLIGSPQDPKTLAGVFLALLLVMNVTSWIAGAPEDPPAVAFYTAAGVWFLSAAGYVVLGLMTAMT